MLNDFDAFVYLCLTIKQLQQPLVNHIWGNWLSRFHSFLKCNVIYSRSLRMVRLDCVCMFAFCAHIHFKHKPAFWSEFVVHFFSLEICSFKYNQEYHQYCIALILINNHPVFHLSLMFIVLWMFYVWVNVTVYSGTHIRLGLLVTDKKLQMFFQQGYKLS